MAASALTYFHVSLFPCRNKKTPLNRCCERKKLESFHKKQSPGGILYKVEHPKLAKFTRKHPCLSLFFNKVERLRPAALFKKRLRQR